MAYSIYSIQYIQEPIGREGAGRTFRSPHICNNHQPEKVSQIWIMNMQIERERERKRDRERWGRETEIEKSKKEKNYGTVNKLFPKFSLINP